MCSSIVSVVYITELHILKRNSFISTTIRYDKADTQRTYGTHFCQQKTETCCNLIPKRFDCRYLESGNCANVTICQEKPSF